MIQIRYWLEEKRKLIFIVFGFLLVTSLCFFIYFCFYYFSLKKDQEKVQEFPVLEKEEKDIKKEEESKGEAPFSESITVDIKGAIQKPGVYKVEKGMRVQDVIQLASGLSENADVSFINLSKKVEDEMVIIVYTREEVLAFQKEAEGEKKGIQDIECPTAPIPNDACISGDNSTQSPSSQPAKVSINQADLEELMTLPGIGESKAQAIIHYREENGKFQALDELLNVSGIGEAVFAKMQDYICL